jgi:hypothetical protein
VGQSSVKVHDFQERLEYSERESFEPFWEVIYRYFFPNMVKHVMEKNIEKQRNGVDRVLYFGDGRKINIQEKKREEDYPDILLEYLSNDQTGAKGWIEKEADCDYLMYAFEKSGMVYLYPWNLLRLAWGRFGKKWKDKYPNIPAKNIGYTTWSVAVPQEVLAGAIAVMSRVRGKSISKE